MSNYDDIFFFFFSSRRRHTRSLCDWSSDVCSSDLDPNLGGGADNFEAMLAVAAVLGGSPPDPGALAERVVPPNADIGTALGETTGTPADNITPLHAAVG